MAAAAGLRIGGIGGELGERYFAEVVAALRDCMSTIATEFVPVPEESGARTSEKRTRPKKKAFLHKRLFGALLSKRIDIAMVELSRLMDDLPEGVSLAGVTSRRTPYYALISRNDQFLDELTEGARVGVDNVNAYGQLLFFQPDIKLVAVKTNAKILIEQVRDLELSAIVLPADDLERLELQENISEILTEELFLPPPGRGCLGILIREGDKGTASLVGKMNHEASWDEVQAERSFLRRLDGMAGDSLGALARVEGKRIRIEGSIADSEGSSLVRTSLEGSVGREEELGTILAEKLLKEGGAEILKRMGFAAGGQTRSASGSGFQA